MIVRILDEGQYEIDDESATVLDKLDDRLFAAIESGDEAGFAGVLGEALELVHRSGTPVDPETIVPSDLTLPQADATLAEVRDLLSSDEP